jgi:hypothetical protein
VPSKAKRDRLHARHVATESEADEIVTMATEFNHLVEG